MNASGPPAALYVHVPFCRAKCSYCDFAREVRHADRVSLYLAALAIELGSRCAESPRGGAVTKTLNRQSSPDASGVYRQSRTVYIGGGTPTSLTEAELDRLLDILARHVDLKSAEEFTVEANPGTLTVGKLSLLRTRGVNRLSLGVQSFQPRLLKLLGRIHTAGEARASVELARAAGFDNLSLDLMHGLPTGSRQELECDLDAALALAPEHLSAYGLTYEEGTPLALAVARGDIAKLSAEEETAQYTLVMERLEAGGLPQYEISNYARPGRQSRHNLAYWRNEPYLGFGPSAASYLDGERSVNERELDAYCAAIAARGQAVASRERLDPEKRAREALILELRLRAGVDAAEFRARWGWDFQAACAAELARFRAQGLMEFTPEQRWRLTARALPVADTVLSEFV